MIAGFVVDGFVRDLPGIKAIGDPNGVVVVSGAAAARMADRLRERTRSEADYSAAVARGDFSNDWVDELLAEGGLATDDPSDD